MEQETDKKSYEFSFLLNGELSELEANNLASEIQKMFADSGGDIIKEFEISKKKLSYPIKKQHLAYFGYFHFNQEPDKIEKLKENLKYKEGILRTLIITPPIETKSDSIGIGEERREREEREGRGERREREEREKEEGKERRGKKEESERKEGEKIRGGKREKEKEDIKIDLDKKIEEKQKTDLDKKSELRITDEKEKKEEVNLETLEDKLEEIEKNI
jgi:ribosomal protein S6